MSVPATVPPLLPTPLDSLVDSLARCFTPETARAVAAWTPDSTVQTRILELGSKANEGNLTEEEAREYDLYIEFSDFLTLLKLKAHHQIARVG
ncbi:MAG: hypothetical protein ACKOET_12465 [Verrucomicrobiota bacterium]